MLHMTKSNFHCFFVSYNTCPDVIVIVNSEMAEVYAVEKSNVF